jgi:hypothetical protein
MSTATLNDLTATLEVAIQHSGESRKANTAASTMFVIACQSGNSAMALSVLMLAKPEYGTDKDKASDFANTVRAITRALKKAGFILSVKGEGSLEQYVVPETTASATATVTDYPETSMANMLQHRHILLATDGKLHFEMPAWFVQTGFKADPAAAVRNLNREIATMRYRLERANAERDAAQANLADAVAMLARVQSERDVALATVTKLQAERDADKRARPMVKRTVKTA